MKLADEKRALAEISTLKRNRRVVEGFQAEQDAIEADRKAADELRKQLDDPESKAMSDRYDAIQAELDELKKAQEQSQEARNKLVDEQNALKAQLPPQVLKASPAQTTLQLEESSAWPPPFSKKLPPIRAKDSH